MELEGLGFTQMRGLGPTTSSDSRVYVEQLYQSLCEPAGPDYTCEEAA